MNSSSLSTSSPHRDEQALFTRAFVVNLVATLAVLAVLPLIIGTGAALTVACQVGVWIVFALAYNISLGQTGLLSFCHGLFFGLGAFAVAHFVNGVAAGRLPFLPVWAMPMVGFAAGGAFGVLLAAFLCKRVGAAFVMITLGLSQLVTYMANALDSVFAGEAGVSLDRSYGGSFGPQIQVYGLIAAWMVISGIAIWLMGRTAFGKLSRAVRENEERVRFLGQDVVQVRFLAIAISAAFAGLAGGLHAINIEQVSSHLLGLKTSAFVLFMVVIGGSRSWFGPVIGAVLIAMLDKVLPNYTGAWLLYLGLAFCVVIMRSSGGLMGMLEQRARLLAARRISWGTLLTQDAVRLVGALLIAVGAVMFIEMANAVSSGAQFYEASELSLMGLRVNPRSPLPWFGALVAAVVGLLVLRRVASLQKA